MSDLSDLIERAKLFAAGHKPWTECYPIMREMIAEIERLTRQRDDLLAECDSFQCDIASALGWEAEGRPFAELVRELYVSYWQPTT